MKGTLIPHFRYQENEGLVNSLPAINGSSFG